MISDVSIDNFIQPLQNRVNHRLKSCLPNIDTNPIRLHEAMHYAVFNGGKRMRPLLVYATGLCFKADLVQLDTAAMAVELIHCYSLVHDDLPAMDDDDYRRGKLSCHKAFDEATAILVGDALQSAAFTLLAKPSSLNSEQQLKMIAVLAEAAGSLGMVGGQQLDLDAKNRQLSTNEIEHVHQLKTGALFRASVQLGALASDCRDEHQLQQLDEFAKMIGLAFQLQDDRFDENTLAASIETRIADLFQQAEIILNSLNIHSAPLLAVCRCLRDRIS